MTTHNSDIPGMVAGGFLLFVGLLMFLVDHYQSKILDGCENGGAGANDNPGLSIVNPVPFVMTFAVGEMTVQHGNDIPEPSPKPLNRLGRQRNFRHQHNRPKALFQGEGDSLQINLSLAATGDAVEKDD